MKAFAIDYKQNTIRAFSSKSVAQKMGNGLVVFSSVDELLENRNTTNQGIVRVYNNNTKVAVKRFSDARTGAMRLLKLAQDIPVEATPFEHINGKQGEKPVDAITDNVVEVKVKSVNDKKKRGRASGYEGKMIKATCDKNPRRENTHGFNSMAILLKAGGPVSYEDYLHAGGRRQDLAWDIEKGYAKVVG